MSGLLYALLSSYSEAAGWPLPKPVPSAAIEVVDLDSMTRVDEFSIGAREPTSLELVGPPLGPNIYVVDPSNDEVVVLTGSGALLSTVPVSHAPSDCVAAPDGSRVYVACSDAIEVIETSTQQIGRTVPVTPFASSGIAISADGGTVVAVGARSGMGVALVLDATMLSVAEVDLVGAQAGLDAAFIERDRALVFTGSSFMQIDTSSATQISGATAASPGSGLTFGISTLQFSPQAGRAFTVDYHELDIPTFGSFLVGQLESLDPATRAVSKVADLSFPPYLIRLAGNQLFLARGHEVGSTVDELFVFDVTAGTVSGSVYQFSQTSMFVTDMRVGAKAEPRWPWPIPKWLVPGSGEGIWFFVDPLWDPLYGVAVQVGLGLGGPLGRGIARMIDNWRRRFSPPREPPPNPPAD